MQLRRPVLFASAAFAVLFSIWQAILLWFWGDGAPTPGASIRGLASLGYVAVFLERRPFPEGFDAGTALTLWTAFIIPLFVVQQLNTARLVAAALGCCAVWGVAHLLGYDLSGADDAPPAETRASSSRRKDTTNAAPVADSTTWVPAVVRRRSRDLIRGASIIVRRVSGEPEPVEADAQAVASGRPFSSGRRLHVDYISFHVDEEGGRPERVRGEDISRHVFDVPKGGVFRVEVDFTLRGSENLDQLVGNLTPGTFRPGKDKRTFEVRPEPHSVMMPPGYSLGWSVPPLKKFQREKTHNWVLSLGDGAGEIWELVHLKVRVTKSNVKYL
jgi:hypothetical protein